jgi:superfamily II DNA or RNA helicase
MHKEELKLFYYQEEAVQKWQQSNKRMLLEMATGCGKTRTAIGCIKYLIDKDIKPFLVVIACPGNTLSVQWKSDIDHLNICIEKSIMCDDTNPGWREDMKKLLIQLSVGYYRNSIIYTTHQTCSSPDFISYIKGLSRKVRTFFIGDEVHGLGARKAQKGLLNEYEMRLGLSATPSRWYDPNGSEVIQKYFGEVSYEFSIKDALRITNPLTGKPFLINYFYYPHFVSLTDEELTKYKNLTERIIKLSGKNDESEQSKLERLLFQHFFMPVGKSAENKYPELEVILDKIAPKIEDTIIFVSPDQINRVLCILARKGISAHSFTEKEGTRPSEEFGGISERDYLIRQFKQKQYKVLVAIKCLDEGIDIPSARCAIVMASSTNPREYIQRIGRVIRQDKNKGNAEIYDMIIRPNIPNGFSEDFIKMEQRIFRKEMDRVLELSENSLNNVNIVNQVYKIIEGLKR